MITLTYLATKTAVLLMKYDSAVFLLIASPTLATLTPIGAVKHVSAAVATVCCSFLGFRALGLITAAVKFLFRDEKQTSLVTMKALGPME